MKSIKITLLLIICSLMACGPDRETSGELEQINIRINKDPQRINPFYSPSAEGREIFQYIFLPLADFHPDDLELTPILINEIPEGSSSEGDSTVAYNIEFREEARWSDGTPVTAEDYIFTLKTINHPLSQASAWKPYFAFFKSAEADPENERKLTVHVDKSYMLSLELAVTAQLFPKHVYDPKGILDEYSLSDIQAAGPELEDSVHLELYRTINQAMNETTGVVQNGPYKLTEYQSDQYVILEKKEDYWGEEFPDNPFLQGYADKLIFRFVPDEVTAVSMAREGNIDLITLASSHSFLDLREDEEFSANYNFHTPQLFMCYYIALNNKKGLMTDVNLRKAIAYLTDVEDYIDNVDGGLGVRTIGHFHPARPYYNEDLKPIEYDPEKARSLIAASGWRDSDNNGIMDKTIDGRLVELELDFYITGSTLSKNMALLLQESAESAGIKINIIAKPNAMIIKENFRQFDYDLSSQAIIQDAAPDDPYSRWHSANAVPGAHNYSGYASSVADSLIENIRTTRNKKLRKDYYLQLQKVMYEDQPVVFLYCPLKKIIIHKRLQAVTTAKRPGYLANTFRAAE